MVRAIEGVYRKGRVELDETPPALEQAKVVVVFLANGDRAPQHRQELIQRIRGRMQQGLDFGGPPYPRREELYDRNEPPGID